MAKKYYAVKKGKTPGIYMSWADCQAQVTGFPGAIFKGFMTLEEAGAFMDETRTQAPADKENTGCLSHSNRKCSYKNENRQSEEIISPPASAETEAVAYVDGSYDASTGSYSYGMVLFHGGEEKHFSEKFENSELATMRNVAGEIEGARAAMAYCLENHISGVTIYHDYMGIAAWCNGDWKAKQPGTISYAEYYRKASQKMKIIFKKVKGHSGDTYNEMADKLAKDALGLG